ncbi:hypothetical protein [Microbacterium sp. SLBN-146]|uniref:hypothetical protein n=1 Tax=Microbacterium sp. SLBN-146 TaxID=2768457 RepID=UPI00116A16B1|nr:hypothetical protein [Microbacterium sp. SLBN-146]TQJ30789.1 putative secreted protein with PEP-CTERM sorting signal [Microbacterium sp. SLBN-146]
MKIVADLAPETVGSWMPEAAVISLLVASSVWLLLRRRRREDGAPADAPRTTGDTEA